MCKIATGKLLYSTWSLVGRSKRGGMGVSGRNAQEGGVYVYTELIHVVVQQKLTQNCRAIILQLKNKLKNRCYRNRKKKALHCNRKWKISIH